MNFKQTEFGCSAHKARSPGSNYECAFRRSGSERIVTQRLPFENYYGLKADRLCKKADQLSLSDERRQISKRLDLEKIEKDPQPGNSRRNSSNSHVTSEVDEMRNVAQKKGNSLRVERTTAVANRLITLEVRRHQDEVS